MAAGSLVFDRLAAELESRLEEVVDRYFEIVRIEVPEWTVGRPDLAEQSRRITRESIAAEMATLRGGDPLPEICPPVDAEYARLAADLDAPLTVVTDSYRRGNRVQWEAWLDVVEGADLPAGERRALLEWGAAFMFDYAGRLSTLVTAEYTAARDARVRTLEQRRANIVRELLDGRDVDTEPLAYDVAGHHVGVVAWGAEAPAQVRDLAQAFDRTLLLVGVADEVWWVWLGGTRPLAARSLERLSRLKPADGVGLAFGEPGEGLEGFGASHAEAVGAQQVAISRGRSVVRYGDVGLELLASANEDAARRFAARELAGLDGGDRRSARLRETLVAYFATGHNAAAAAARLGVHEQTVAGRLRAVEERTGRAVAARRAELETALRLRALLDGD